MTILRTSQHATDDNPKRTFLWWIAPPVNAALCRALYLAPILSVPRAV